MHMQWIDPVSCEDPERSEAFPFGEDNREEIDHGPVDAQLRPE